MAAQVGPTVVRPEGEIVPLVRHHLPPPRDGLPRDGATPDAHSTSNPAAHRLRDPGSAVRLRVPAVVRVEFRQFRPTAVLPEHTGPAAGLPAASVADSVAGDTIAPRDPVEATDRAES